MDRDQDPVQVGIELLGAMSHDELDLAAAMDRIEAITDDPATQREILDTAEAEGIIERDDQTIRPTSSGVVSPESDVVVEEGDYSCSRCGTSMSTGYFVRLETTRAGPFGSTCIRWVLGLE